MTKLEELRVELNFCRNMAPKEAWPLFNGLLSKCDEAIREVASTPVPQTPYFDRTLRQGIRVGDYVRRWSWHNFYRVIAVDPDGKGFTTIGSVARHHLELEYEWEVSRVMR